MNFRYFIGVALLVTGMFLHGQEVSVGLQTNELVRSAAEKLKQNQRGCDCKSVTIQPALDLPFFDDFSVITIYPDSLLWEGRSVFVNKSFPYMPPNQGAATFDAIDEYGAVYDDAVWYPPVVADILTSRPIRLDSLLSLPRALSPADSLYLSFFYQPQGVGFKPEAWDTLVLEFGVPSGDSAFVRMDSITLLADVIMPEGQERFVIFDTLWAPASEGCDSLVYMINYDPIPIERGDMITILCDSVFEPVTDWKKVWFAEGQSLEEFKAMYGDYFLQVMIPIVDTIWFNPEFRFRFYNCATISNEVMPSNQSNNDQWNVDYVYLNYNRSKGDTTYRDIAFSQPAPSFLKDYQVMPYPQYRENPTQVQKSNLRMYIANLDNIAHNTAYEYSVQQVGGSYSYKYDGGNCNLNPFYETGFQACDGCGASHACPPVSGYFNTDYEVDTISYIIKHYISDSSDQNSIVDSAIYRQGFYNYFAYDDGVPEEGYGLVPRGAHLAYQFTMEIPDTLQGVQMYFNKTLDNANEFYFKLMVWSDNNGRPGEVIYEQENQKVAWSDGLYLFYPYMLDEPFIVSGTFYVGWEQYSNGLMNIGLDKNNDHSDRLFYDTIGGWVNSRIPGSLLMRPIVGSNLVLGVPSTEVNENTVLKVYPNPTSSWFSVGNVSPEELQQAKLEMYNLLGKRVMSVTGIQGQVNIEHLPAGLYVVKVISNNQYRSAKLLINR